jgi:hypothetical protein
MGGGQPLVPGGIDDGKGEDRDAGLSVRNGPAVGKEVQSGSRGKEEFWDRWVKEKFPSLLRQRKPYKYKIQSARKV